MLHQCVNRDVKTFVIDTEAVAYDIKEKKLLPFQQLTTRKRKDVRTEEIPITFITRWMYDFKEM